jgi:hypothetical protein
MVEKKFLESKDILLLIQSVFPMQFTYNQAANITFREGAHVILKVLLVLGSKLLTS